MLFLEVRMPIPLLNDVGELPPGIHLATVNEVEFAFGRINNKRRLLMMGLKKVIPLFKYANVSKIYIDGSFTSDKEEPSDIDGCWSVFGVNELKLDPRFWNFETLEEFERNLKEIKDEFYIDFFIAEIFEGESGKPFPEFFQTNRDGKAKGIIQINL